MITLREMADAAEVDVLAKKQRLEIIRQRVQRHTWSASDAKVKEAAIPVFEAIAALLRELAQGKVAP